MSDAEFDSWNDEIEAPEKVPDGTYLCKLIEFTKFTSNKTNVVYGAIKWEIVDEGDFMGEEITEMWRFATNAEYNAADADEKQKIRRARVARNERLRSLGVKDVKKVDTEALLGIMAHLEVKVNDTYLNVKKLSLVDSVDSSDLPF